MKDLPLYREPPGAAILQADPVEHVAPGASCDRCPRARGVPVLRPAPRGIPGGILAVAGSPTRAGGRMAWSSGLESEVAAMAGRTSLPITYDHALRCPPPRDPEDAKADKKADPVAACRGYLRQTLESTRPKKVLLFGPEAQAAFLGWTSYWPKLRQGAHVLPDGTEVHLLPEIDQYVLRNTVTARWAQDDVQHAVTATAMPPPRGVVVHVIETLEDAHEARMAIGDHLRALDCEWFDKPGEPGWALLAASLAVVREGVDEVYVWPEEALRRGDPRAVVFAQLLRRLVGHNIQVDLTAVRAATGADPGPGAVEVDTQVFKKTEDAQGSGALDQLTIQVGMGGHKHEMEEAMAKARIRLRRLRRAGRMEIPTAWAVVDQLTKGGKVSRRKVAIAWRPATSAERRQLITWAWHLEGALTKLKAAEMAAHGATLDPMPAKWLHAAERDDQEDMAFLYGLVDQGVMLRYNAADSLATARAAVLAMARTTPQAKCRQRLWSAHLRDAPWAVGRVAEAGLLIDEPARAKLERELDAETAEVLARIHRVKPGLNPGSGDQLAEVLFSPEGLGLPIRARTESGAPATDKVTLLALKMEHPVVADILEYKKLEKFQSNWGRGLRPFIRSDGRVRCSLNLTGAESGRMSASDPNLQTVPSRDKVWAKRVKSLFIAPPGRRLLQFDYKTLEVVIAAMLSGDPVLLEVFLRRDPTGKPAPGDPHKQLAMDTSSLIWGTPFETCGGLTGDALLEEQAMRRYRCKTVLFGALYGQGPQSLAEQLGIPLADAERIHAIVLGRLAGFSAWVREVEREALRTGFTWTWWAGQRARCRPVPDVGSPERGIRGHGLRAAMNTRIQGTGHEFCLASLVAVVSWLWNDGLASRVIMPVHDSLLLETPEEEVPEVVERVPLIMTSWQTDRGLRLMVDPTGGPTWAEQEKLAA